jgi:hypothetical protein
MRDTVALPLRRKLTLAWEIVTAYVRARRLLRRHDLPSVIRELRSSPSGSPAAAAVSDERLARAVRRTLRALPANSRCLMQSLVLTHLLARRGRPASLVIGVSPAGTFTAHAWVERDGVPLLPAHEDEFSRLAEL